MNIVVDTTLAVLGFAVGATVAMAVVADRLAFLLLPILAVWMIVRAARLWDSWQPARTRLLFFLLGAVVGYAWLGGVAGSSGTI